MRKPIPPEYLYLSKRASVSPSWVQLGKTSYTVSSIMKLTLQKLRIPRVAKYALFFVSLVLLYFSTMHLLMKTLPVLLAIPVFVSSLIVFAVAGWLALVKPAQYRLTISLADGTHAHIRLRKEKEAQELHDAITRAVDYHRDGSGGHAGLIAQAVARRLPRSA